jgi:hypothetical protein
MNTAASALFTYVNLQMAAESIQIREGYSGAIDPDWLRFGIQRASPPPLRHHPRCHILLDNRRPLCQHPHRFQRNAIHEWRPRQWSVDPLYRTPK